jgi:hypothetical protein
MSVQGHLRVIDGNGELNEDLVPILSDAAALMEVVVKQRQEIAGLKRAAAKLAAIDPDAETIGSILEYWRDRTARTKNTKLPVDGKRWRVVKARLRDGYEPEQLKRAIDAVVAFPWMEYGDRFAEPGGARKKRNEIAHAIGDEERTDRNIRLAAGDGMVQSYRWFVHRLTVEKPWMVHALAELGAHEAVHGEVLAAAVLWASASECYDAGHG